MKALKWLTRIGPGFVIAAVVLGPGSLTAATRMGAGYGYAMLWVPLLAGIFMAGFVVLFMRFGVSADKSLLSHAADLWGRPFAAVCGLAMFYVTASFQFGNNIGVATGMDSLLAPSVAPGQRAGSLLPPWAWIVGFNGAALLFLFAFRRVYAIVEKTMTALVAIMVVVFFANLYFARPRLGDALRGLAPSIPPGLDWVAATGLVATTFSLVGALFQTYLVRARRWTADNLNRGLTDSISGMAVLTLVTMVVLMTSASVLHPRGVQVRSAADMAGQLETLFGTFSRVIFCIGFVSAAFSSFLVNAMIGGTLLSDGLGLSDDINSRPARIGSALGLLAGMAVALLVVLGQKLTFAEALLLGEAGTLLGVPLAILAALLVLFYPRRAGARPLSPLAIVFVTVGVELLVITAAISFPHILAKIAHLFG